MGPRGIPGWRWVLLLSVLGGWLRAQPETPPLDLAAFEGRPVRRIVLLSDGPLTRIDLDDVYKLLAVEEGRPFSQSAARRSIQRLHATRVFHDVRVAAADSGDGVEVSVTLIRRHSIASIDFSGSLRLSKSLLRRAVTLRAGDPYNEAILQESLKRLAELYRENGYYQASIEPRFELDHTLASLSVVFEVVSGPKAQVGEFSLQTGGGLDPEQIIEALDLRRGRPFSEAELNAAIQEVSTDLVGQGYLDALIYVQQGPSYQPSQNTVDLTVRVTPRRKTEIRFEGAQIDEKQRRDLPVFVERSAAPVFLQETAEALENLFQSEGRLLAAARYSTRGPAEAPEEVVFEITPGDKLSVGKVAFSGHRFQDEAILRRLVSVRTAGLFSRGRLTNQLLSEDVARLLSHYRQRGFLDVNVSVQPKRDGKKVDVLYRIKEGERYMVASLDLIGVDSVDPARLQSEIQLVQGGPFSPLQAAQDRANVIAFYENLGYRQVDFRTEIAPAGPHSVTVKYIIREGGRYFVDAVVVTGNRATRKRVVNREIAISPGSPLSLGGILETEANLYSLAVFNRVQVNEAPSYEEPSQKTVLVNVEEAKQYTLVYGIGYSSFEGPRGTIGVTNNNFLGLARTVTLGLRAAENRQRANLSYSLPRVFGRRLPTVLSFTVDNEEAQTTRTIGPRRAIRGRPFDAFRLIGSSQTERRLSRRESLFFRYLFEDVTLDVPENLAAPLEFFREEENLRLSSLSLSYLNESRDDPSEPTRGFFASGDVLASSRFIGSEAELLRFFGQAQYYRRLGRAVVWASSIRLGMIAPYAQSESVPISERFFSGGATTLRGLPQDLAGPLLRDPETGQVILVDDQGRPDTNGRPVPLGGNATLVLNTELRFPVVGFLKGAVFYDVGNVYSRVRDIFKSAPTHSFGLGALLSTPVGPLRFDVGYNPNPPDLPGFRHFNFHFTLGHPF